jgi:hypothetical protein
MNFVSLVYASLPPTLNVLNSTTFLYETWVRNSSIANTWIVAGGAGGAVASSFMRGDRSISQLVTLNTVTNIGFNRVITSAGTDISLNTSTGLITLAKGKVYRLIGGCPVTEGITGLYSVYWFNNTTNLGIGNISASYSPSYGAAFSASGGQSSHLLDLTLSATDVTVFLKILSPVTGNIGVNIDFSNNASQTTWFDIEVISGNSPFTQGSTGPTGATNPVGTNTSNYLYWDAQLAVPGYVSGGLTQVKIGNNAGVTGQGSTTVAIGNFSGNSTQGTNAIAIGDSAGEKTQGVHSIAIGSQAGQNTQGEYSVAIGYSAGLNRQRSRAVAIGIASGNGNQGTGAVGIGLLAGNSNQGREAVAIGPSSGQVSQGVQSVAIGFQAGQNTQGANSVAIGYSSGLNSQATNSVVINGSGVTLEGPTTGALYIKPIRDLGSLGTRGLQWDTTSGEISAVVGKTFIIDHPIDSEKYLVHACLEGPESGVYYRGVGEIKEGNSFTTIVLPDYVDKFATNFSIQVTPILPSLRPGTGIKFLTFSVDKLINGSFKVHVKDTIVGPPGEFYWHVYGSRNYIPMVVDPYKKNVKVKGVGPYKYMS